MNDRKPVSPFEPIFVGSGMPSTNGVTHPSLGEADANIATLFRTAMEHHRAGRMAEAETTYRTILDTAPHHDGAVHYLGMVEFSRKNFHAALELVERSVVLCNDNAVYHNNHGVILKELGRLEEAEAAFTRAVELRSEYPDALSNLGLCCMLLNRQEPLAERFLKNALRFRPDHHDALRHLAGLYEKQHRHHDAVPVLESLSGLEPHDAGHRHRLGCLYGEIGDIEKSKRYFREAASMPMTPPVWRWKHLWYSPMFFETEKEIDKYWANLNADLDEALSEQPIYNWRTLAHEGFTHSFHLPHHDRCCRSVLEKFSKLFAPSFPFERPNYRECGENLATNGSDSSLVEAAPVGSRSNRVRVGFLVTPGHEGGFLRLTCGVIDRLDPEKFEVVLFYNETTRERYEGKFQRPDLKQVPYSWNFSDSVRTIRDTRCDVMYFWKVAADPWSFFLPMCRLAPIQFTSWATHGTSGVPQIDYYLTWDRAEVPDAQKHYTEELFLIETTPCFESKLTDIPPMASRSELGLPETGAIYFCPHRPPKYHPSFDEYLKRILERDPSGHVVLLMGRPSPTTERFRERMRRNLGEVLFERMIFRPQMPVPEYYRHISVATVILNSPIYSGEITAVDGFLYGVPCVAKTGEWLVQRYTTAFYDAFGIDGPAASTMEEYVEQAVKLGTAPDYRGLVSEKILANHDGFFENQNTVQEWERFLFTVISRENPSAFRNVTLVPHAEAVPLESLEINVAYACNLSCNYCSHFSRRLSGVVSTSDIFDWFRNWRDKISPANLRLIGGEPLLHPELSEIIREAGRCWPKSRLNLATNGLLLPKRLEILDTLRESNMHVFISRHFMDENYLHEFESVLRLLEKHGIAHTIYTSERQWRKYYHIDPNGDPSSYDSNPDLAWKNCHTKNICPTLLNNRLYKCQHLAHAILGVERGVLPDQWNHVLKYRPLDTDATSEEIFQHLNSGAIPECGICPERYEYATLEEKRWRHP